MTQTRTVVEQVTPAEAAFRRNYRPLVGLAAMMTGSLEAAEDIVQDAFVRCGDRLGSVRDADTYLRAVVANACRSWHRHERVVARHAALTVEQITLPSFLVELQDALLTLDEGRRAAIVLRFVAGFDDHEIARVLGCRPATVRSRIHRGLAELRLVLTP